MHLSSKNNDASCKDAVNKKRLSAYLATAGGIGLASTEQAGAVIVSDLTDRPFGVNESVDIDFNSDGVVDFQIDHDRVDLGGSTLDYLQLDKNDFNGAVSGSAVQSELAPIDAFGVFPGIPNDYNANNVWDAADYTVWRDNVGQSGPAGDGDENGVVDLTDYNIFSDNFGATPANNSRDHGYMSDQLLCDQFSDGGCYVSALEAGDTIGPSQAFEFQESDNAFGNGTYLRTNRLIDEDGGQVDASFGFSSETRIDSPQFTGLSGAERFLGVRVDLNDAGFLDNTYPSVNAADGELDDGSAYIYGWIGIQITNEADATGLVTGYAYETELGVEIAAGATASSTLSVPEPTSSLLVLACVVCLTFSFFSRRRQKKMA